MNKYMKPVTIGEFLKDYMKDYNLSAYRLAKDINVPVSRIQDLLHDRRKMTIDTSMRLGKYFNLEDGLFFFKVQTDLDYKAAKLEMKKELDRIKSIKDKELDNIKPITSFIR